MSRSILAAVLLAAGAAPLWAISEGGAIFLMIRPGARASGMGSAFCAIADDATATYFNPAGLAFLAKESRPHLSPQDVRNWRQLAEAFQGAEQDYLLDPSEISDPDGLVIRAGRAPLFCAADVADWRRLLATLADTAGAEDRPSLGARLDPALLDELRGYDAGNLEAGNKASLLRALNGLLADRSLFRLPAMAGVRLPEQSLEALDRAIYTGQRNSVKAEDIAQPRLLAQRLASGGDAPSRHVAKGFSQRARTALTRESRFEADSLRRMLAAELSRIAKAGPLYNQAVFPEASLKPAARQLAAMQLRGDELARLNLRILADAFPAEIDFRFDRELLTASELRTINRHYLETVLKPALAGLENRVEPGPGEKEVMERMGGAAAGILGGYDGTQEMRAEDVNLLVDELNRIISAQDFPAARAATEVPHYLANRQAIDQAFRTEITPSSAQKPKTARLYLRQRLERPVQELLDRLAQGTEPGEDEQALALSGINSLIDAGDLYQPAYFPRASLGSEARSLVSGGVEGLSQRKLQRLNRLLLESELSGAVAALGAEGKSRHATLMHSPWLSEIWGDVGDMYYEFIAYAQPVRDWGVFGGNLIFLSEGKNQHLDEFGNVLGEFSSYEFSPTLSYGNKVLPGLGTGVNLKVIHSHLAPFGPPGTQGKGVATTWAVDLGLLYHTPLHGLSLGCNLQNLGPKLVYIDAQQADPLSRNLRLGLAYKIFDGRITKLTSAFDITRTVVEFDPSWSGEWWKNQWRESVIHFGNEYVYTGFVQLALRYGLVYDRAGRIGTKLDSSEPKFSLGEASTFGGSVGYRRISFDVALEPGGELMNGTKNKKFALSFNF
jgi:hypothetical protein